MVYFKKLALMTSAIACVGLSACSTFVSSSNLALSKAIVKDSIRLNEAYNQATNGVILKNILRARDRVPTNFTTLSGIQSTPQLTSMNSLALNPIGLGNPSGPFQESSNTVANTMRAQHQYNINPFAGGGGRTESLLFDVSQDVFERYWGGWPKEVVFYMFVESVTVGSNEACVNKGVEHQNFLDCFNKENGQNTLDMPIEFEKISFEIPQKRKGNYTAEQLEDGEVCTSDDLTISRLVAEKAEVESLEKLMTTFDFNLKFKSNDTSAKLAVNPPTFNLCREIDDSNKVFVHGNTEFKIKYRSFDDIIYYLGETLREPVGDNGPVSPKVDDACQPGSKNPNRVPLMKVHEDTRAGNSFLQFPDSKYAVSIQHGGQNYNALPLFEGDAIKRWKLAVNSGTEGCLEERTSTVIAILNQLLLFNQSATFLQAPENTLIQ